MDLQDRIKQNRVGCFVYKQSLLGALAVTKVFQKLDWPIPNHWQLFVDTLSVTSSVAHEQLSFLDEEIEEEFVKKERRINQVFGKGERLYSKEELEKLRERRDEMKLPSK